LGEDSTKQLSLARAKEPSRRMVIAVAIIRLDTAGVGGVVVGEQPI
jgi:hypothetical protein